MPEEAIIHFDPALTSEARKKHKEKAKVNPDWEVKCVETLEVIRNHLMVAHLRNGQYHIFSDEPPGEMGGEGLAPSMCHYFLGGALLCEAAQYVWNLGELGLLNSIRKLEMSLHTAFSAPPWCGVDENGSPAFQDIIITARISSDAPPEDIIKLARIAAERDPAHQTLNKAVKITNVVELNGKRIAEFSC